MVPSEYIAEQDLAAGLQGRTSADVKVRLLVSLALLPPDAIESTLDNIAAALPGTATQVTVPGTHVTSRDRGDLTVTSYTPQAASTLPWIHSAADYLNLYELAKRHSAEVCLLLGAESQSLQPGSIRALVEAASTGTDLATPRYDLRPREGLVNSAILYPVSRALYGSRPRFPLSIDLALSLRMAERLAMAAQRYTASGQNDALLWPVAEAAVAGFTVTQVEAHRRSIPQPAVADLNALLAVVAGSLFADVEAKAAFWQRSRVTQPQVSFDPTVDDSPPDILPMLDSFRLAYTNLQEIWSLVLPPQTLLGLKKLSLLPADTFRMPDALWARTVYDFMLAYRLRTLNRGHLLGALTPLYLAWVASHLNLTFAGTPTEKHVEETAAAFESEKPYFVSRWRWPDRFNP